MLNLYLAGSASGWYWFNNEPYSYTNWQSSQPSTQGSCALASLAAGTSQWMVEDCERYHGIGCKLRKGESHFKEFNNKKIFVTTANSLARNLPVTGKQIPVP